MANVRLSEGVPQLTAPSLSAPQIYAPQIKAPHLSAPGKAFMAKRPARLHPTDLGDIVLGGVYGTKQLRNLLEDYGYNHIEYVPILNKIIGAGLAIDERFTKPLFKGDIKTLRLNGLETLANTMDTLSNPIKSLMPWAGGGSSTDLLKSMGWAENEYREHYQWNTNSFIVNIIGEYVSDPLNWATLGMSAIGSTVADTVANTEKQITKALIKSYGAEALEVVEKDAIKNLTKQILGASADESTKIIQKFIEDLDASYKQLANQLTHIPHNDLYYKTKQLVDNWARSPKQLDALTANIYEARTASLYKTYEALTKASFISEKLQKDLLIAATVLNPVGGINSLVINKLVVPTFKAAFNKFIQTLKPVINTGITEATYKEFNASIRLNNGSIHKPIYSTFKEVFRDYDYDENKLMDLYVKTYNETPLSLRDPDTFDELFKEQLLKRLPRLQTLVSEDDFINNIDPLLADARTAAIKANTLITKEKVDELINAVSEGGRLLIQLNDVTAASRMNKAMQEAELFWKKNINKVPEGMSRLNYLVNSIKEKYNDFELENLIGFLSDLQYKDYDSFLRYSYIFNYLGITADNAAEVASIMERITTGTADTSMINRLQDLLTRGKTGYIFTQKAIDQNQKYMRDLQKRITKGYKIDIFGDEERNEEIYSNIEARAKRNAIKERPEKIISINTTKEEVLRLRAMTKDFVNRFPNARKLRLTVLHDDFSTITNYIEKDKELSDLFYSISTMYNMLGYNLVNYNNSSILKEDYMKLLIKNYDTYINTADVKNKLRQILDKCAPLKKRRYPLYNYMEQLVKFSDVLNSKQLTNTVANIKDLIKTGEDLFIYTSVEHGDLITVTSNLAQSNMDKETWGAISDINGTLRKNLRTATSKLRSGITPEVPYKLVPNLHRADGVPVLAYVDANNNVYIKDNITKKEFFDYIQGKGLRSDTSIQKRVVFKNLDYNIDELKDLIKSKKDIEYFLYQHEYSHIKNNDSTKYIPGVENLLHPDNIAIEKKATKYAIEALKAHKQRINIAYQIDMLFSTIDATNNINRFLANQQVLSITQDKDMQRYLQGLMYNMIYKHKDIPAAALFNPVTFDNIVDTFVSQAQRDNLLFFETQPEMLDRLRNAFTDALNDYTKTQHIIGKLNNTDLRLLQTWNYGWFNDLFGRKQNAARIFDTIGLSYKPVLESLMLSNTDPNVILDTSRAINFISDNVPLNDFELVNKKIKQYANSTTSDEAVSKYINRQLRRVYAVTLSEAINNAEREIAIVNKKLTRAQAINNSYWLQNGEEQAKNALAIMLSSETDEFTKQMNLYNNRYNATTAHQYLGFKKVLSQDFITNNYIRPEDLPNVTNKGYNLFYNKMLKMSNIVRDTPFNDTDELNIIKNSLINLFMDKPDLEYSPKDPLTYFNKLTDKQLKMWDMTVTDPSLGIVGANEYKRIKNDYMQNRAYTYSQRIQYRTTPESIYEELRDCAIREGVTDTTVALKRMTHKLVVNEKYSTRGVHDIVTENFSEYIKAPEDLGKYRTDVNNYIQHDLNIYNELRPLDQIIEDDSKAINKLNRQIDKDSKKEMEMLKSWGVKPYSSMNSGSVRMYYSYERNDLLNQSYNNWSAEQLRDYIDRNNPELGFLVYKVPESADPYDANLATKFTKEELDAAGLIVTPMEHNGEYFIRRTSNVPLNKAKHDWYKADYKFVDEQGLITGVMDKVNSSLRYENCTVPKDLWTGTSIPMKDLKAILNNEELMKLIGDVDTQRTYMLLDENGNNIIFNNKKPIPNTIFIGDIDTYNSVFYRTDMTDPMDPTYIAAPNTNILDRELWATATQSIDADNTDNKVIQLFFNNDFNSNNAMYNTLFEDMSDEEIKEVFKRNNWVATVLRQDKQGKPKVYKYFVDSQKTLQEAKALDAIIIPHESYRTLVLTLNKHSLDNKVLRTYYAICSLYKSIYLTTPGFLMRNEWDSNFIKNLSSTRGMQAFNDNISYRFKARKLNAWYEDIQKQIAETAQKEMGQQTINKYYTRKVISTLSKEDQQLYIMLDMFNRSPASAGLSEIMQRILFEYNDAHSAVNVTAMEQWLNESIYKYGPVKWINSINDTIERDARLSLFLNLTEHGLSPDDAIRKIIDTHFDYELSAFQLKPIEQLMWFSVFPFNNLAYYLNEGLTKHPNVLKLQLDMMRLSWNADDITWEDVKNNNYYSYNVLAGNIRFKIGDKNIVLKLGSSVMDFFQLITDPTGTLKERVNPFLSVLLGFEDTSELNPFNANISRVKQIVEGRSYVPSVYTTLTKYTKKKRPRYFPKEYSSSSWTRYPKKIRKPNNRAIQMYTKQTYRYYFGKGKNLHRWLSSTTAIEPHWYMHNWRYLRTMRKYKIPVKQYRRL